MTILAFLFHTILLVNANFKCDYPINFYHKVCSIVEAIHADNIKDSHLHFGGFVLTPNGFVETESTPSLEEVLKKDVSAPGIISNILGGITLFYNALTRILLYPIFSFLLLLLSLGGLILLAILIKKLKNEQPISNFFAIFCSIYVMLYIDLFLVVYQKSKILFLFLELEREVVLITIAALIGYTIGKFFSNQFFEEKKLP